jgi:hypothetical protein
MTKVAAIRTDNITPPDKLFILHNGHNVQIIGDYTVFKYDEEYPIPVNMKEKFFINRDINNTNNLPRFIENYINSTFLKNPNSLRE